MTYTSQSEIRVKITIVKNGKSKIYSRIKMSPSYSAENELAAAEQAASELLYDINNDISCGDL